jgi:hypothetical protein
MKVTSFAGCITILLLLSTVADADNIVTIHPKEQIHSESSS